MTEAPPPAAPAPAQRARRRLASGGALAWIGLLAAIGFAILLNPPAQAPSLALANPDSSAADGVRAAFDGIEQPGLVLVAMDADMGTYPEIRATVHAAMADLVARGSSLAIVSVSAEGRALAAAELDRLRRSGLPADRLLDLGFVSGAEAGMVRLVDGALRPDMRGPMAALIAQRGGGIGAFDLILLVGGGDIGPRSWVEQVGTRLPSTPMVAIAPTFSQPELRPYLRSGQLSGLLATVRDDAAYVARVQPASASAADGPPSALAMLVGMLAVLAVLLRQLLGALPRLGGGSSVLDEAEEA
jgi:hypothetical protein